MLDIKRVLFISIFTSSILIANENTSTRIDDITVSANKMEENIQDVPQSISVLTLEDIEQKGIKDIQDLIKEIPNMGTTNSANGAVSSFRGLNTSQFTNSNPVVIYVDGVPYYDKFDFNPSFANIEQIEVLRGPQGTLYGKDAIGAVINIVTKAPKNKWSGNIGVEYGNNNTLNTKLNTNGAIIDDILFAGINGSFYHTDGWIENHYPGMDKNANKKNDRKTSGFLLWKPTDNLSARLTLTNNFKKKYFIDGFSSDPNIDINDIKREDGNNVFFDVPAYESSKINSQALNISYELDNFKFESTTTHKKTDFEGEYDSDNRANNLNDGLRQFSYSNNDTLTQELKLSGTNKNIKWITGLYFDKEDRDQGPYGAEQFYNGSIYIGDAYSNSNNQTAAIFGQSMISLGENFELTLGGRYQKIKKDIKVTTKSSFGGIALPDINYDDEETWNTFLPKAALSYKINDNLTSYLSISKGYMPGGFNFYPSSSLSEDNKFEAQESLNYEIGAKYIGENFALNTAIFRMDIKDIHVYKQINGSTIFQTANAKKAHSQGLEIDGIYFLTDNWSISGALGLIQAKYDDYDNGTRKFDGEKVENTPSYTANLSLSYIQEKGLYGMLNLNAQGKTTFIDGANNDRRIEADGGMTIDTKIGYRLKDFDIYAYAKNITNEDYVTSYVSKVGTSWIGFNEPRQFGIGAIYKF